MNIIEFIIDQKEEADRCEKLAKRCKNFYRRCGYESQKYYHFQLCCEALCSFGGRKIPGFVREYVLGLKKEKPTLEELQDWYQKSKEWDIVIPLGVKIAFVAILTFSLIAIIFL